MNAPPHLSFAELEQRWLDTLNRTTAEIPVGSAVSGLIPGYAATATKPGLMTISFDNEVLTGKEAVELLIYGELIHIDRAKEKKLLKVRESELAAGYQTAVIAVLASLLYQVDHLREYAEAFIEEFRRQFGDEKIKDIEERVQL